jgi:biopolymer transport protein ExbD
MRAPKASQRSSASANMTPMIDVVFLLIIFFLVSSHLAKREARMPLDLPLAATHQENMTDANRMTINLAPDGSIEMGATSVSMNRMFDILTKHQRDHEGVAAVRIRTDKTLTYGTMEPLLRALTRAGVVDIVFAVHEGT